MLIIYHSYSETNADMFAGRESIYRFRLFPGLISWDAGGNCFGPKWVDAIFKLSFTNSEAAEPHYHLII